VRMCPVKILGFCVLPVLLSIAAHGGIADALGASGTPLSEPPVSPSRAAAPPSRDLPAGGTVPDALPGSPRNPNPMPMPAPAPTIHYAGPAENPSEYDQWTVDLGSRRSISLFTTA
jgi:hypothetical protein